MCENITCNMSENKSSWYQSLPSIVFFSIPLPSLFLCHATKTYSMVIKFIIHEC